MKKVIIKIVSLVLGLSFCTTITYVTVKQSQTITKLNTQLKEVQNEYKELKEQVSGDSLNSKVSELETSINDIGDAQTTTEKEVSSLKKNSSNIYNVRIVNLCTSGNHFYYSKSVGGDNGCTLIHTIQMKSGETIARNDMRTVSANYFSYNKDCTGAKITHDTKLTLTHDIDLYAC